MRYFTDLMLIYRSLIYIIDDNVNQPLDQYLKSCPLLLSTP